MANTIDSGQPLHNTRPNTPLSPLSENQQSGAIDKERGPLGPEAQGYLQQAKQDVEDIRKLGANSDDPEACLDSFVKSASRENGVALAKVVERLCSAYEGDGHRQPDRRVEPQLRQTGQRIQGILQRYGMSDSAYSMLADPLRRINKALDFNGIPPYEVPPQRHPMSSQAVLPEPIRETPPQDKRP